MKKNLLENIKLKLDTLRLIVKYPFLLPRNVFTDKVVKGYFFDYCLFRDDIEDGWWNSFGTIVCDDLKDVLKRNNFIYKFRFSQIKQKYGSIRLYDNGHPKEWEDHLYAWEYISEHTCEVCGKFPVPIRNFSYITPLCDDHAVNDHWDLERLKLITEDGWDGRVQEYLVINSYSKDEGQTQKFIDMKPFYDKLGWKYTEKDLISKEEYLKIKSKGKL